MNLNVVDGLTVFLTKSGFYDKLVVHRLLPEFMDVKFIEEVIKHGDEWVEFVRACCGSSFVALF